MASIPGLHKGLKIPAQFTWPSVWYGKNKLHVVIAYTVWNIVYENPIISNIVKTEKSVLLFLLCFFSISMLSTPAVCKNKLLQKICNPINALNLFSFSPVSIFEVKL